MITDSLNAGHIFRSHAQRCPRALGYYGALKDDDAVGHADIDTPARPPRLSIDLAEDLLADFRIAAAHWFLAQQFDKHRHQIGTAENAYETSLFDYLQPLYMFGL